MAMQMRKEKETEEKILQLHDELLEVTDNATEEDISRVMFKVLLFALVVKGMNENVIHNYSWKYFEENKKYFMQRVP